MKDLFSRWTQVWRSWSLARQFGTSATLVLVPAMFAIGTWVSSRIEQSVTHSAGFSAALYMESFIEPLIQDLATSDTIAPANMEKLSHLLADTRLRQKVLSFKVWTRGNRIIAGSRPDMIGKNFPPGSGLAAAWRGIVSSEFDHLVEEENVIENAAGIPLLEVYVPLHERGTGRIIAVGEFYEKAPELRSQLNQARLMSWLVVGAVTLSMLSALFVIVRRGSQTIEKQQIALSSRVDELTRLLAENSRLRARIHQASARSSESTEQMLRRLGADLHDGPAQMISLALLRLEDQPAARPEPAGSDPESATVASDDGFCLRATLSNALNDIRNIASGLALPEIERLDLKSALRDVVRRHEEVTRTQVDFACDDLPEPLPHAVKLCAYRFLQEGLANAFRHAGGQGQMVRVGVANGVMDLVVADSGPGMKDTDAARPTALGLRGLLDRIESLGGQLTHETKPGRGTRMSARLPITTGSNTDA